MPQFTDNLDQRTPFVAIPPVNTDEFVMEARKKLSSLEENLKSLEEKIKDEKKLYDNHITSLYDKTNRSKNFDEFTCCFYFVLIIVLFIVLSCAFSEGTVHQSVQIDTIQDDIISLRQDFAKEDGAIVGINQEINNLKAIAHPPPGAPIPPCLFYNEKLDDFEIASSIQCQKADHSKGIDPEKPICFYKVSENVYNAPEEKDCVYLR